MAKNYNEIIKEYSNYDIDWNLLKDKTIMISGITGLIGRFFADLIMEKNKSDDLNCTVVGLCRNINKANEIFEKNKNLIICEQDVTKRIEYNGNVDYVIHAASNTHPVQYATDPIGTIKTNVYGTNNLLEFSKEHNVDKFILLSSFEVYGKVDNIDKISEDNFGIVDCTVPRSCYPESKRLSESLAIAYSTQENVNVSIIRLSRVFGPTMALSSSLATAQFIKNAIDDNDIVLKSDGTQLYSYNYVGDAVTAIITVLLKGEKNGVYNVSDEAYDLHLKDFAQIVSDYNHKSVIYDLPDDVEKRGFSNSVMTVLDSSKLKDLGWKPLGDIKTDINDTINVLKYKKNNNKNLS